MKLDIGVVGFGVPVIAGVVLALIGHPSERLPGPEPAPVVARFALKSVSVELPTSDVAFPAAAGVDAATANCLACHSAGMVLTQPAMSNAAWQAEVEKMIHAFKAPVAERDVATIVDYLHEIKGSK